MELWYRLVSLLPFSWAEADSLYFMKNALLAVVVVSPLFGLLSTMVVTDRMSFFSDALGHSAFTGIAIGVLCGFAEPMWAAALFALVLSGLYTWVRRRTDLHSDTIIGVFSSAAVALGVFVATFGGGSFTKFNAYLIGDILSVEPGKIGLLALILLATLALWLTSFDCLLLSSIHPALARSRGINVGFQQWLFTASIALVVTCSMTWVGLLVINSLLVLPAAGARNLAGNVRAYHLLSLLSALVSGVAGLLTSYYLGSSTGACITLYLTLFFLLSLLSRRNR